jgi:hypothetical protein
MAVNDLDVRCSVCKSKKSLDYARLHLNARFIGSDEHRHFYLCEKCFWKLSRKEKEEGGVTKN